MSGCRSFGLINRVATCDCPDADAIVVAASACPRGCGATAKAFGYLSRRRRRGELLHSRGSKNRFGDRPLYPSKRYSGNVNAKRSGGELGLASYPNSTSSNLNERPLYAVNHSARVSMKSAASCVN